MKNYSDVLSDVDGSTRETVRSLFEKTCEQLNSSPSVMCSSSNPNDADLVRKVSIEETEGCW